MATYEMKDPTGLTDDELGSLEEAIVAAFTAADEADDLDAVRAEKTGRESAPATEEVIASGDPDPDELEAEAEALEAEAEAVEDVRHHRRAQPFELGGDLALGGEIGRHVGHQLLEAVRRGGVGHAGARGRARGTAARACARERRSLMPE